MKALGIYGQAQEMYRTIPQEQREIFEGYAAGYNRYLKEVGPAGVCGWCRGQPWLSEISPVDAMAYAQAVTVTSTNLADLIATAAPPKSEVADAGGLPLPDFDLGSNGWAIGSALSESGRGMLVANPHYPWVGSNRFWEKHLIIPGKLNVYGVSLLGIPGVLIGFNDAVAWTYTVSAGKRFTMYTLDLVPGNPAKYYYDGREREMTKRVMRIEVRQEDGSTRWVERLIYFSHYGPILNISGMEWTTKRAVALRDANANNVSFLTQQTAMAAARNLDQFKEAHKKNNAIPWVNTIAVSAEGRAWYADISATPNLKKKAITSWQKRAETDLFTKIAWQRGMVLLDGSNSLYEWVDVPGTRAGVLPYENMPQLERSDYVFNANDSFWLANPHQLLTGFPPLQGAEGTARSLRTRMNAIMLDNRRPGGPAGKDGKFSWEELATAVLANRSMSAELLRDALVGRCKAVRSVEIDGKSVDLGMACEILERWNGRYDLDSVGAVLWREFITIYDSADLRRAGNLFRNDLNPADPVNTPSGLAEVKTGTDPALKNLARAIVLLHNAGIALDTPLGKLQYSDKRRK